MTAMPCLQCDSKGVVGGIFFSAFRSLAKFALSARIEPERAENIRWRDSHNIYSTAGCQTASIQSP